jgi:hypothetical protein
MGAEIVHRFERCNTGPLRAAIAEGGRKVRDVFDVLNKAHFAPIGGKVSKARRIV